MNFVHQPADPLLAAFMLLLFVGVIVQLWRNRQRFPEEADMNPSALIDAGPEMFEELKQCQKELLGASSYLATCDPVVIVQNLGSFTASLNRRLASVEAVIRKANGK
jgi:hypothetical protein